MLHYNVIFLVVTAEYVKRWERRPVGCDVIFLVLTAEYVKRWERRPVGCEEDIKPYILAPL